MKHIIIDLEMNKIARKYHEERLICESEIIEIGAVALNDDYSEIASFKTFVKPEYNDIIAKSIEEITKISIEMVENAPVFQTALEMFLSWCNRFNDDIQIYQWSENDLNQILKEMHLKRIEYGQDQILLSNWHDIQKEYGEKLTLTNAVSLKNALMNADLDFDGQEHDALCDAKNTASLLKLLRDPKRCKETLDHIIEVLTPKTLCTSLGDLFALSKLMEICA